MIKNIAACLFVLVICCSFQKPADVNAKLLGTWVFERFDFPVYVQKKLADEQTQANKGLVITFTKDGKVISTHGDGINAKKTKMAYKISPDNKYVIMRREKSEIQKLDDKVLMLSLPGRPVLVLKRKK